MRILFITFQFPYPPISGASIKTLSLLDYLRHNHEVHLISLRRGALSVAQQEWATDLPSIDTAAINKPRNAWSLLSSYAARVPLRIERNRSPELARLVQTNVDRIQPDALFCDGLSMAQYVPSGFLGRKLLHEHNAEYLIWQRQAEIETGPRRWMAAIEAARLRRYEASTIRRFDTVFVVSEDDRRTLLDLGAEPESVRILPNIPDRALLEMPPPESADTELVILYFGTLSWQPNIEGLERLITSVFPGVRRRVPNARLVVAGVGASRTLKKRVTASNGAEFRGEVDDPEPLYRRARVVVDATRSGGGTRLKVLNAFARGIPVVASTIAAEGLDVAPDEHLLVADNDQQMTNDIVELLTNGERWQALRDNARALVRARYVAEIAYQPLDEALTGAPARAS
jgi:glycosyltransferase involved in cell wall biosynthesis